jgi:hypothetical protein
MLGEIDLAQSTRTKQANDGVPGEYLTVGQWHGRILEITVPRTRSLVRRTPDRLAS